MRESFDTLAFNFTCNGNALARTVACGACSLVIATVLGAYCPFLIETHLCKMFLHVETAEQCFHNALKLTDALRYIGIEYEINARASLLERL